MAKAFVEHIQEALGGTVWVEPGYDLTAPACPEWADLIDDPLWNAWADELPKPLGHPQPLNLKDHKSG